MARLRKVRTAPPRPLSLLIPGAVLALGSFGALIGFGLHAWSREPSVGFVFTHVGGWLIPYVLGIFVFLYAYYRCDLEKALQWTLVVATVGALVAAAVVALLVLCEGELPFGHADASHGGGAGGHGGGHGGGGHGGDSNEGGPHGGGSSTNRGLAVADFLDDVGEAFHGDHRKRRGAK